MGLELGMPPIAQEPIMLWASSPARAFSTCKRTESPTPTVERAPCLFLSRPLVYTMFLLVSEGNCLVYCLRVADDRGKIGRTEVNMQSRVATHVRGNDPHSTPINIEDPEHCVLWCGQYQHRDAVRLEALVKSVLRPFRAPGSTEVFCLEPPLAVPWLQSVHWLAPQFNLWPM